MEHGGQILFYSEFLRDGLPKVRGEAGISVADDLCREAEPLVYVVKV